MQGIYGILIVIETINHDTDRFYLISKNIHHSIYYFIISQ